MTFKRAISYTVVILFIFILAVAIVLAAFSFFTPHLLEKKLLSNLKHQTGISDLSMHVRKLDLQGADFSDVRIGPESEPALVVRSIQIDYSLAGLYQKKIKQVSASGIELYSEFKNGKFGFRGVDLESLIQRLQSRPGGGSDSSEAHALVALERLLLRNAVIVFDINSKIYRVPCEIDIRPENATFEQLRCTAFIYARGQKFVIDADIDLNQKTVSVRYAAKDVIIARFADFTGLIEGLSVTGVADLSGTTNLKWEPLTILSHVSSVELRGTRINVYGAQFQNPSGPRKEHLPLRIHVKGGRGQPWGLEMSAIAGVAPVPFLISEINSRFNFSAEALQCSGSFMVAPLTAEKWLQNPLPVQIAEQVPLRVIYSMQYSDDGTWSFDLANQVSLKESSKINIFKFNRIEAATQTPVLKISGNVGKGTGKATYTVKIPQINISSDIARMTLPALFLDGTATLDLKQNGLAATTFNLKLPGSWITADSAEMKIPQLTLSGKAVHQKGKKPDIEALLRYGNCSIAVPGKNTTISGIQGTLPIRWPPGSKVQAGRFSVGRLNYQNMDLGQLSGTLQQTARGILFAGTHTSRLVPKLSLTFQGNTKLFDTSGPETQIQFQLAPAPAGTHIDLGKFLPQAAGVSVGGNFVLDADLVFGKKGLRGSLYTALNKGYLQMPENKASIEGIQMAMSIPQFPNLRSAPQQHLRYDRAAIGAVEIRNGKIEFQIESLNSILIEKSQFKWVDGNVDTYAIRLSPGVEDYRLILYCDRVNLAKLLQQLGVAKVEAEGELNGRIPLHFRNGKLRIDDGFLFSTPGVIRKIRMLDTELLTAGMPPGSPQYVQMELARKALEDYDYGWVKLNINSEGEDLVIRMQLDGKPANPLPFVYRKDLGRFVKIEAGGQGSIFQGIRLDVNFKLPFNKLFQYREILKMIQ